MKVASGAVGGPILTVNEYRAQIGYPPIDGGDVLIKPLNITKPGDQNPIPAADDGDTVDGQAPDPDSEAPDTGKMNGHRLELAAGVTKILEEVR
jgi:hypothetical protein